MSPSEADERTGGPRPHAQCARPSPGRHHASASLRGRWTAPAGLSPTWRRILGALVGVQLAVIIVVAMTVTFRFHFLTLIDEEAHFAYIQQIAQHGSLPVLGKTENSQEGLAMSQGVYPRPTTIDPKKDGLGGYSYEAFQPPLYYIAAVPAFYLAPNYVDKVYTIRFFDALLLFTSIALAGRLCRLVLADRWMIGWSMTMVFFALPGVVVRFVTISNLALAVPLAVLFVSELWIAWSRRSLRRLLVAGVVLGFCVLTELELVVLIPVFVLVAVAEARRRRREQAIFRLAVIAIVPLVIMSPWFVFNESNYHMLTAGPIAIEEQTPIVNPHHLHYSITNLPNDTVTKILDPTLPAEWAFILSSHPALNYIDELLAVLLVPASIVMILALGRRLWSIPSAILGLPWLLNVFELWYIRYGEQWTILARYTFPTLPSLLVLAADGTDAIRARFLPVLVTAGATGGVIVIWAYLLFGYTGGYAIHW